MAKNKWIVAFSALFAAFFSAQSFSYYDASGVNVGLQFGYGNTAYNKALFPGLDIREDGIAGRIYLGDQFNPYVGLELGAAVYSETDLTHDTGRIRTEQLDLLLRLGGPIPCSRFRVDLKLGAAVMFVDIDPTDVGRAMGIPREFSTETRPAAGISVAYNFNRNIAIDVSYLHVFGNRKSDSHQAPNGDLATLGLSFFFPIG